MATKGRSRVTKRPHKANDYSSASVAPVKRPVPSPPAAKTIVPPSLSSVTTTPTLHPSATVAAPAAVGSVVFWISAFTKAFPYMLLEYCFIILVIQANAIVTLLTGGVLAAVGISYRVRPTLVTARLSPQQWHSVSSWIGDRSNVATSVTLAGATLLIWSIWNDTGVAFFSVLSLLLLLAAVVLLMLAQAHPELERDIAHA